MKILGIAGSLRRASLNARLLTGAAELLPPGASLETWDGLGALPHFNEDLEDDYLPEVEALRDALQSADALLIATPEYNGTIPGPLKNAVDWASRPLGGAALRGLPAAIVGATSGAFGAVWAQADLRKTLRLAGAVVLDRELGVAAAHESIDDNGRLADADQAADLAELLADLTAAARARAAATGRQTTELRQGV